MPDQARRPFLQSSLTGLMAMCIPAKGWAARPPREGPLIGVDSLLTLTGLTARWQNALRRDLGMASRWSDMDSAQVLAQLEQGQIHIGLFLSHPKADELARQGLIHSRHRLASTDVLLLGPVKDVAGIRGETDIVRAMAQIRMAVGAGAAAWRSAPPLSALDALTRQLDPTLPAATPPATQAIDVAKPPAYRLMTRAQWLRQPPSGERLKVWPTAPDARLVLHAEVACAMRARHGGNKLLVDWLRRPMAQSAIKAARPAWQPARSPSSSS
jgi:hypothetical protein